MNDWSIRVPGSSANLGAGFDVLGMAIGIHAEVGCGRVPAGGHPADEHHPATIAFRRLGGEGPLWTRTRIPMGRGLGYSGAVRVGGAAAAVLQHHGPEAIDDPSRRAEVLSIASELEGHADNAAASLEGGVVVAAADRAMKVPIAFDAAVVAWIPDRTTTSTDRSRTALSSTVTRADAVFNLGRVGMFVAACATGEVAALRAATEDRLHQEVRLSDVPTSAEALDRALAHGAWAAWLSGSGPTVALLCHPADAERIAAVLPSGGHAKVLDLDHVGATVVTP